MQAWEICRACIIFMRNIDAGRLKELIRLGQLSIKDFANKWIEKFQDPDVTENEILDHYMADDCKALGFRMDCNHAFGDVYGSASHDVTELRKIIDTVNDTALLGSAIFSQWRYFNHWAGPGESVLSENNREWFLLVLGRLLRLNCKSALLFHGEPIRMKLESNCIGYGPMPEPGDIVGQDITIIDGGCVWFYDYQFGRYPGRLEKNSQRLFTIDRNAAKELLDTVAKYFSNNYEEVFVTDVGQWTLRIINSEDQVFRFDGSLCGKLELDGVDLSQLLRKTVGIESLFAFDGNG